MPNIPNDGKITINIKKSANGEMTQQEESVPKVEADAKEKDNTQRQAVVAVLIDAGKQAAQQGFQTYTEISGDYQLQRKVNLHTNVAADVLIVVKGRAIGAIAVATKYALGAANAIISTNVENKKLAMNNKTLGTISMKGSRYW